MGCALADPSLMTSCERNDEFLGKGPAARFRTTRPNRRRRFLSLHVSTRTFFIIRIDPFIHVYRLGFHRLHLLIFELRSTVMNCISRQSTRHSPISQSASRYPTLRLLFPFKTLRPSNRPFSQMSRFLTTRWGTERVTLTYCSREEADCYMKSR